MLPPPPPVSPPRYLHEADAYDSELRLQDKLEQHGDELRQGVIGLRDTKRALEQQLHAIGAQTDQVRRSGLGLVCFVAC